MGNKENKKLDWLNIHCDNRFFITTTECETKFNIRDTKKQFEFVGLSRYMLNKELDNLECLLSNGRL